MNGFTEKLKNSNVLIFAAALAVAFFAVFTVLTVPEVTVRSLCDTKQDVQDFPANPLEKASDVLYTVQRTYRTSTSVRLLSFRRNFQPVPPTCRFQDLSSLPLVKQISKAVSYDFYGVERSHFQQYLKYALPLRAGPFNI